MHANYGKLVLYRDDERSHCIDHLSHCIIVQNAGNFGWWLRCVCEPLFVPRDCVTCCVMCFLSPVYNYGQIRRSIAGGAVVSRVHHERLRIRSAHVGGLAVVDSCPPQSSTDIIGARWRVQRWGVFPTAVAYGNVRRSLAGRPLRIPVHRTNATDL